MVIGCQNTTSDLSSTERICVAVFSFLFVFLYRVAGDVNTDEEAGCFLKGINTSKMLRLIRYSILFCLTLS